MFRARLAQVALAAGLGLVTGCSACYSFSLGAPGGGNGGGLFSRFHRNTQTPTAVPAVPADCGCVAASPGCDCPVTPGCGCAAAPCCEGPVMGGGYGGFGGGYGGFPGAVEHGAPLTPTPLLSPTPTAPISPTVPYAP